MSLSRQLTNLAKAAVGIGGGIALSQQCLFDVDAGKRVVIFDKIRGIRQKVYGEGTHFKVPFLWHVVEFDVRTRPNNISTVTGTKDLQNVNITLRVLSRPRKEMLPTIWDSLGTDFDARVLPSVGNEVLKSVVAQYPASELLTKRDEVSKDIRKQLTTRCAEFHIDLDDVSITHLTFGTEFTKAIEHKQVAQQEAERAKFIVEKSEQEKKAKIITSEGESESAELFGESIKTHGNGFLELSRIHAATEIAHTLARSRNVTYMPPGNSSNMLLSIK